MIKSTKDEECQTILAKDISDVQNELAKVEFARPATTRFLSWIKQKGDALLRTETRRKVAVQLPAKFLTRQLTTAEVKSLIENYPILEPLLSTGFFETMVIRHPDAIVVPKIIPLVDKELMKYLQKHPEELYRIHPGIFERIIAEIFEDQGFETELIGRCNAHDGGVDIIAVKKVAPLTDVRFAIQCKRYATARKVGVQPIRELAGVLDRFKAHKGVLATTSYFTKNAWKETDRWFWMVDLYDFDRIKKNLLSWGIVEK